MKALIVTLICALFLVYFVGRFVDGVQKDLNFKIERLTK
jgi:hypothetical protein